MSSNTNDLQGVLFFDAETSIHNKGNPFDPRNFAVSYVVNIGNSTVFKYYKDPDFTSYINNCIKSCNLIIAFNGKFDIHWLRNLGIVLPDRVKIWDCQL